MNPLYFIPITVLLAFLLSSKLLIKAPKCRHCGESDTADHYCEARVRTIQYQQIKNGFFRLRMIGTGQVLHRFICPACGRRKSYSILTRAGLPGEISYRTHTTVCATCRRTPRINKKARLLNEKNPAQ